MTDRGMESFLRNIGDRWCMVLSSARVVVLELESWRRNPLGGAVRKDHSVGLPPLTKRRKVESTSNHHACCRPRSCTVLQWRSYRETKPRGEQIPKASQFELQAAARLWKSELLVIAGSACAVNTFPGGNTHPPPSHHETVNTRSVQTNPNHQGAAEEPRVVIEIEIVTKVTVSKSAAGYLALET